MFSLVKSYFWNLLVVSGFFLVCVGVGTMLNSTCALSALLRTRMITATFSLVRKQHLDLLHYFLVKLLLL